jgi:hypothetical protein
MIASTSNGIINPFALTAEQLAQAFERTGISFADTEILSIEYLPDGNAPQHASAQKHEQFKYSIDYNDCNGYDTGRVVCWINSDGVLVADFLC